jgi:LPS-assembly lipoprotein
MLAARQDAQFPGGAPLMARPGPTARACAAVLAAAAAAALLSGCGFRLQGHTPLPAVVKNPYVEAPDRQSDFIQSLRHALLSNGARLMQDRAQASVVVSILKDTVARRVLSVSALNQPNEYEVTYTVGFSVTAGDKELLPPQELTSTRTYSFDERLLLAKGHEEDILRQDMARDLADRVMRRLSSL